MKISIVTISFNQSEFLRQCIDSVQIQNDSNFEHIIVDPGSVDGSREIIHSYGTKITPIFEPDNGPADGLNKGFSRASGDIFAFLNSDDEFIPGALERIRIGMSTGKYDVLSGGGYITNRKGASIRRVIPSRFTPWLYAYGAVTLFQQGTFFRSEYFKKVGGFNPKNRTCWDGELFLDMSLAGARFGTIAADVAKFRIYEDSITGSNRQALAYKHEKDRLFQKAMQRPRRQMDNVISHLAKGVKYIVSPSYAFKRLFGR